jgi:hypothetical protein
MALPFPAQVLVFSDAVLSPLIHFFNLKCQIWSLVQVDGSWVNSFINILFSNLQSCFQILVLNSLPLFLHLGSTSAVLNIDLYVNQERAHWVDDQAIQVNLWFFFFGRDWTQSLMLARQVLYLLSHAIALLLFVCFLDRGSWFFLNQPWTMILLPLFPE